MIIETTYPVSMENIEKYFLDESPASEKCLVIKVSEDTNPDELFIFLSNLQLNCDIDLLNISKLKIGEFIIKYMATDSMVPIPSLIDLVLSVLLVKGKREEFLSANSLLIYPREELHKLIKQNEEIVNNAYSFICSLPLFALSCIKDKDGDSVFKNTLNAFPVIDNKDIIGLNLAYLLTHKEVGIIPNQSTEYTASFYKKQFTTNIFRGDYLFKYFDNPSNPFFVIAAALCSDTPESESFLNELNSQTN